MSNSDCSILASGKEMEPPTGVSNSDCYLLASGNEMELLFYLVPASKKVAAAV
jgi:hypothetical protein